MSERNKYPAFKSEIRDMVDLYSLETSQQMLVRCSQADKDEAFSYAVTRKLPAQVRSIAPLVSPDGFQQAVKIAATGEHKINLQDVMGHDYNVRKLLMSLAPPTPLPEDAPRSARWLDRLGKRYSSSSLSSAALACADLARGKRDNRTFRRERPDESASSAGLQVMIAGATIPVFGGLAFVVGPAKAAAAVTAGVAVSLISLKGIETRQAYQHGKTKRIFEHAISMPDRAASTGLDNDQQRKQHVEALLKSRDTPSLIRYLKQDDVDWRFADHALEKSCELGRAEAVRPIIETGKVGPEAYKEALLAAHSAGRATNFQCFDALVQAHDSRAPAVRMARRQNLRSLPLFIQDVGEGLGLKAPLPRPRITGSILKTAGAFTLTAVTSSVVPGATATASALATTYGLQKAYNVIAESKRRGQHSRILRQSETDRSFLAARPAFNWSSNRYRR